MHGLGVGIWDFGFREGVTERWRDGETKRQREKWKKKKVVG
jgi:hypothetical protein